MSKPPNAFYYSPLETALDTDTAIPRSQSPPALASIGSGLQREASHPAGAESAFFFMNDDFDDVTDSYGYRPGPKLGQSSSRSRNHLGTGAGRSGGGVVAKQSVERTDGATAKKQQQQGLYSMMNDTEPNRSTNSHDYGLYDDVNDGSVPYGMTSGAGFIGSFTRPAPGAPASTTAQRAPTAVDTVGVPPAMFHSGRRPHLPPTPKASSPAPRRRTSATTPSAPGPGGIRLDSILMNPSQVANAAVSPSREAGPKRGSRFVNYAEDEGLNNGSFAKSALWGSGSNCSSTGPISPSTQRKRVLVSVEGVGAGSAETGPPMSKGSRSLRVNLAHKALIGKGSYGMVFQAMDRDTNRIIAVKEIALTGYGGGNGDSGYSGTSSSHNGEAGARGGKRSMSHDDTVVGSTNGATSSPASNTKNSGNGSGNRRSGGPKSPMKTAEFRRRLEAVRKELAVLKQLDHPNIVKCLGEECDEGYLRIYMELVPGGSVSSVLRVFGNLQERQAADFTRQVLEGLTYLHSKGIVHRDLKGDNLLVDTNGTLKLADFGTARDMQTQTHSSAIAGTAYFMAPEVISGEGSDAKSDIWSVGCCVVEMLTGKPPLPHLTNQYSIMMFIAESKGELFDKYIPEGNEWSADVLDFLRKCLARDPAKRPPAKKLLTHPWITNPPDEDTIPTQAKNVVSTTAVVNTSGPPHPAPVPALSVSSFCTDRSPPDPLGGTGTAETDLQSLTPTSEKGRRKKDKKSGKREKEKKSGSGRSLRKGADPGALADSGTDEYRLDADFFRFAPKAPNPTDEGGSPSSVAYSSGGGAISPRWPARESKRGLLQLQQTHGPRGGASVDVESLPEIRAHSSTATSMRSPFLPSLSCDKTPSSAHAVMKSNSYSQWGVLIDGGSSRRSKGNGNALMASSHLTKPLAESKEPDTPPKEARRELSVDDVLLGKDDSVRSASNNRMLTGVSPPQSLRKQKVSPSPRMPPLPSPKTKK